MLGAAPALQAAIPGIQVDAVVSRQFHEAPGIVTWRSQTGGLPGTLVCTWARTAPSARTTATTS